MKSMVLRPILLAALSVAGCGSPNELVVELRTDFLPGMEFASVHTELVPHAGEAPVVSGPSYADVPVVTSDDLILGRRVAELSGLRSATYRVSVELRDLDGRKVASRQIVVRVQGAVGVTAVITRDCVDVECPGSGDDPAETECAGARCVRPECTPEHPEACAEPACTESRPCPSSTTGCAETLCGDGVCLAVAHDDECAADQFCHPELGCTARDAVDAGPPGDAGPDAGPSDGGPPDAPSVDTGPPDAGIDAGPPDAGPPDAGPLDAGPLDAGPPDAGPSDAGPVDSGAPDTGPPCACTPGTTRSGGCARCLHQVCNGSCRWGSCEPIGACGSATECVCCDSSSASGYQPGWQCCNMSSCNFYGCTASGACGAGCC